MSRRARIGLFAVAGIGLLIVLGVGVGGLPPFGHYHGVYGLRVSRVEPAARHATDIVTALNFDLRAFDTLGEEFILFASVTGLALLLRHTRADDDDGDVDDEQSAPDHAFADASDALRGLSLVLVLLAGALGGYLALHGHLTPGGGFQAGVVLAAALLAALLAGRYPIGGRAPSWVLEALESIGASGYALVGIGGLVFAVEYMQNFLPLGQAGEILSAGMIPVNSIAVAVEVTGAFLLTWTEFLDQALTARPLIRSP